MIVHTSVSVPAQHKRIAIDVEKDFGISIEKWNSLSSIEKAELVETYVNRLEPVCWLWHGFTVSQELNLK